MAVIDKKGRIIRIKGTTAEYGKILRAGFADATCREEKQAEHAVDMRYAVITKTMDNQMLTEVIEKTVTEAITKMRVRKALNLRGLKTARVKHGRTEMTKSFTTVFNNLRKKRYTQNSRRSFD